jgi:ribosomal protein S25
MVDKRIDDDLSPDAYYLLIKLMKLAPNEHNNNDALKKKTGFSKRKFDRAKKELVTKGYLDVKQLHGNYYALYIGQESASNYKQKFKKSNNRYEHNELRKIEKEHIDSIKKELSKYRWCQIETIYNLGGTNLGLSKS